MEKETAISASCPVEKLELRRDVTVWGSYMWGYADVGADIYAALGLVMGAAHGGASLAFFVAGLIYIMIGLSYTEMASTYPVAGGGHYYALRGLEISGAMQQVSPSCWTIRLTSPSLLPLRLAI